MLGAETERAAESKALALGLLLVALLAAASLMLAANLVHAKTS